MVQKQAERAAFARGQRKPPRGGEIGRRAFRRQFGENTAERAAFERFLAGIKNIGGARHPHDGDAIAGMSEKIESRCVKRAGFMPREIGLDEKALLLAGGLRREGQSETRHSAQMRRMSGRAFMQGAKGQSSAQGPVEARYPQSQGGSLLNRRAEESQLAQLLHGVAGRKRHERSKGLMVCSLFVLIDSSNPPLCQA